MPTREENLESIQRAEEAAVVLGIVQGFIDDAVLNSVNSLVAHYRGGKIDSNFLLGKTAEMSALFAFLDSLRGAQRAGEVARDREFNNGKAKEERGRAGGSDVPQRSRRNSDN